MTLKKWGAISDVKCVDYVLGVLEMILFAYGNYSEVSNLKMLKC